MGWFSKKFKKKEEKQIEPVTALEVNSDYQIVGLLESFHVTEAELELDKIEGIAESLSTYFGSMIKDISKIGEIKEDSQLAFVFARLKKMVENALELHNLLGQLVDYYYNPVLDILRKVGENKEVINYVNEIEEDKKNIEELSGLLSSFALYDDLLNPEKRDMLEVKKDFTDKEFKRKFLRSLRELKEAIEIKVLMGRLKNSVDLEYLDKVREGVFS